MRASALLLLCLAACTGTKPPASGDDTGGSDLDTDSGADTDTIDTDDTAPDDCVVELPAADLVDADPACVPGTPDPDPFEVEARWPRIIDPPPGHTPVVAHVDDDNGDGIVGSGDQAEIAAVSRYGTAFAVMNADGSARWEQPWGWSEAFDPLFADLDGDGAAELVLGHEWEDRLAALDGATGVEKWRTEALTLDCRWSKCLMTAADLDGDGVAEVIVDQNVIDGATGALKGTLALPDVAMMYRGPLVADMNLDGMREIVMGDTAFSADGTPLWSFGGEARSAFPALIQLDEDPEAELAISLDYDLLLLDTDGTELHRAAVPGAERFGWAGPPCVGDLDGDGASEVVVPGGETIDAFYGDGSLAWSVAMFGNDGSGWYSGATGCAVFDFDRDGDVEVLLGDAASLRILDGTDGATLWESTDYSGYMELQGPVVADIDADGSAEILASSTGHILNGADWAGLQIYAHPRGAWRTDGSVWGVHDFAVGNQTAGGGLAAAPAPTWVEPGVFRGQVAVPLVEEALAALVVTVADTCGACDADVAHVSVVVGNVGAAEATDATVELRAVAADGSWRVLATAPLAPVASGATHAGVDLSWAPSALLAGERLEVAATLPTPSCEAGGVAVSLDSPCE